jgi:hypothetical protein
MAPKSLSFLASLLAFSATTFSLTVTVDDTPKTPNLILAPGLPSLESLGLTVADLYKPDFLGNETSQRCATHERSKGKTLTPPEESRGIAIPKPPVAATSHSPLGFPSAADVIPACYTDDPALRGDAIACRNALITMGTSFCDVVAADYAVLCQSGSVEIIGWNYYNVTTGVTADCSDVAIGASWIIDNCSSCSQDNCYVEGGCPFNPGQ